MHFGFEESTTNETTLRHCFRVFYLEIHRVSKKLAPAIPWHVYTNNTADNWHAEPWCLVGIQILTARVIFFPTSHVQEKVNVQNTIKSLCLAWK